MNTSDFSYLLPAELIAQYPSEKRDACRLLCLDRGSQALSHLLFSDLPGLMKPGDRLVLNDTRVVPARLMCRKVTGGLVELLFTQRIDAVHWRALVKPSGRTKAGTLLRPCGNPQACLVIDGVLDDGSRIVSLTEGPEASSIDALMREQGEMPLPPYIKRRAEKADEMSYQTVFARNPGAIACPTAGLHFTPELLSLLDAMGVGISFVTLHVGIGTFRPVKAVDPRNHDMHEESYELTQHTADEIAATRRRGGRTIAVGTTVVRVLEHCSRETGVPAASKGSTRLLLLPGHRFRAVDGIITNFHVPQSTLLMLVCAFADRNAVLAAYEEAIRRRYRFFSYGDAMIIL